MTENDLLLSPHAAHFDEDALVLALDLFPAVCGKPLVSSTRVNEHLVFRVSDPATGRETDMWLLSSPMGRSSDLAQRQGSAKRRNDRGRGCLFRSIDNEEIRCAGDIPTLKIGRRRLIPLTGALEALNASASPRGDRL